MLVRSALNVPVQNVRRVKKQDVSKNDNMVVELWYKLHLLHHI